MEFLSILSFNGLDSCERFQMVLDEETTSIKDCGVQINKFCATGNIECVCACACAWSGRLRDWVFRRRGDCNKYTHSGYSNTGFGHSMCAEWLTVLSGKILFFFGWPSVACFHSTAWSCCDVESFLIAHPVTADLEWWRRSRSVACTGVLARTGVWACTGVLFSKSGCPRRTSSLAELFIHESLACSLHFSSCLFFSSSLPNTISLFSYLPIRVSVP